MKSPNRLHRLLRLLEILQSGRTQNSTQLADLCEVSRRTVFRDIVALQEAGVHVLYDEERQGYYLPGRRGLTKGELTVDEALALLLVCQEIGGFDEGIPFQEAARNAAIKIAQLLPMNVREVVGEMIESFSIRLDPRNPLQGARSAYETVMGALLERQQVRLTYHSAFEQKTIRTLVSPYRLLFSRRSWYVIGRSSIHREVRTFNIGRIAHAELVEGSYLIPPRFSLNRYLGNAWHLIREKKAAHHVLIRFTSLVAQNVEEIRWHKTQSTERQPDGSLLFRVNVDGLQEISWWIMGYGDQAEVLEPAELRQMMAQRARNMARVYENEPFDKSTK